MTPALTRIADALASKLESHTIEVIDPYGERRYFRQEKDAYAHFSAHVRIPAYGQRIRNHLLELQSPVLLIGFSAGASGIFPMTTPCPGAPGASVFTVHRSVMSHRYTPQFDIHLIFPGYESHFDVDNLIQALSSTPNIFPTKSTRGHGFMNEYSKIFDPDLYQEFSHYPHQKDRGKTFDCPERVENLCG